MFDWDDDNEDHIAKHGFGRQDAENVLLDPHRVMVGAYNHRGERRYGLVGATTGGRILHAVYTLRNGNIRVFHLKDANQKEKRRYKR